MSKAWARTPWELLRDPNLPFNATVYRAAREHKIAMIAEHGLDGALQLLVVEA